MTSKSLNSKGKSFVVTVSQSGGLITSTIIGVGVLTLPRTVTESSHQAGWITTLLAGMITLIGMYFIVELGLMFPGKTFVKYSEQILGTKRTKWVGKCISFPLAISYIIFWGGPVHLLPARLVRLS